MSRLLFVAALGLSALASAEAPRIAIHPLDARELTVEQREWLKAFYDVRLARTPGIQLAGSNRIDEALRGPGGKDCETKDSCLRHLAEASGSLYAVYARLRREPLGGELMMTARVVRSDGVVVKSVSRRAQPERNVELIETCRTLVSSVVDGLALQTLPAEMPRVAEKLQPLPPPPLVAVTGPVASQRMSPRRTAGLAIAAVGVTTLVSGGILFGLASDGRSKLTPDATGAVPASQVNRASAVAVQGQASSVLIPVGVIIGVGGALLALWPEDRSVRVSLNAGPEGAGVLVGARFP